VSDRDRLSKEDPARPAELVDAMRSAVGGKQEPTASDLLDAAERLLDKVLRSDCETRSSALDLLTVDALMTHALLWANNHPERPMNFGDEAMRRIASHSKLDIKTKFDV
jgi:hypothetical protein